MSEIIRMKCMDGTGEALEIIMADKKASKTEFALWYAEEIKTNPTWPLVQEVKTDMKGGAVQEYNSEVTSETIQEAEEKNVDFKAMSIST